LELLPKGVETQLKKDSRHPFILYETALISKKGYASSRTTPPKEIAVWIMMVSLVLGCSSRYEGELPNDCTDQADNDRDGEFDCQDNGCINAPKCIEAAKEPEPPVLTIDWDALDHKNQTVFFRDVLFSGKAVVFFDNGQLGLEHTYKNGKLEGQQLGWHEDGKKRSIWFYKNDKPEGKQQEWHES